MARRYDYECLYWKFLLCRRFVDFYVSVRMKYFMLWLTLHQGIGMVISAQWELVLGNTYGYTVLSAFGFFYGGFGAIITPLFGVTASYGTDTVEYNNALGYFVLSKFLTEDPFFNILTAGSVGCLEFFLPDRFSSTVSATFRISFLSQAYL